MSRTKKTVIACIVIAVIAVSSLSVMAATSASSGSAGLCTMSQDCNCDGGCDMPSGSCPMGPNGYGACAA